MAFFRKTFRLSLRTPRTRRNDVDTEIAFHIQERIDALVDRGWSVDAATTEAARRFGDIATQRAALQMAAERRDHRLSLADWVDAARADLKVAVRQLRRSPTFAFGTIAAFALGVGANATMFDVIDRLLLRPPAQVAEPSRLFTLRTSPREQISYPAFVDFRDGLAGAGVFAVETTPRATPIGRGDEARMADAVFVDGDYFRTLGVRPRVGRVLAPSDATLPNGQPVVVIGYGLWQSRFGGDPGVVGAELVAASTRVTIIGVAPREFHGVGTRNIDLWFPLTLGATLLPPGPSWPWATAYNAAWLNGIVRLSDGVEPAAFAARATVLMRRIAVARSPRDTAATVELRSVIPSHTGPLTVEAKIAALLGAVSLLVLVIACSNAASLMLSRAIARRRETAIRLALGVSRRRLASSMLVDTLVLALLGGLASVAVAVAGASLMRSTLLQDIVWEGGLIGARTIAFIVIATVVAGVLTAFVPAFVLLGRFDLRGEIGGARQSAGPRRNHAISALVLTQTVLSAALLTGALLFVRSLGNVQRVPLGVDLERTVGVTLDSRTLNIPPSRADALFSELTAAVARVPGVSSVASAEGMPFSQWFLSTSLSVPGIAPDAPAIEQGAFIRAVTPSYFTTIGTRVVEGQGFAEDRPDAERVAVVSRQMADALWPTGAIGRCVRLGADTMPCRRIVGVAEVTQESAVEPNDRNSAYGNVVYVPLSQGRHTVSARTLLARIDGPSSEALTRIRAAVQRAEPEIPLPQIWVMQSRHDVELRPWRLGATMFGVFGVLALLVTALGLYSVISYGVTQRLGELAIRTALGGQRHHIIGLIGRRGAVLAAAGTAIATLGAVASAPFIQPLLFQTSARSIAVYLTSAAVVLAVSMLASVIPALRAARVSPMAVLRSQ
jgi:predicted permease